MWIGMIASEVAQLCLGTGLIVLGTRLWTHAKRLAAAGMGLEAIALVTLLLDLIPFSSLLKGGLLPPELLAATTGAPFVGMAPLGGGSGRTRALPRVAALVVLHR